MAETQRAGMQGLARAEVEAVVDEGTVRGRTFAAQDFLSAVALVVEQCVADALHVDTDLVGASSLQLAFHEGDVSQSLQYAVVGDGGFAVRVLVGQYGHLQPVFGVTAYVAANGTLVLGKGPPDEGIV